MNTSIFKKLRAEELISAASLEKVQDHESNRLFSVHWELKTILYLGVLLLSTGAGILIYKNIDTIGHTVILLLIALVSAGSFAYCLMKKPPFTWGKAVSPDPFFDYILLLGCLSLVTFIGYLQFQYNVFGNRFGLAVFIPMLILFTVAYYFDHVGVLAMAITALAGWAGIAITPSQILASNNFDDRGLILTGFALGAVLIAAGVFTRLKQVKTHFSFTYTNFGAHILFIACLAAMFYFENIYLVWFALLAGIAFYFYKEAFRTHSFYFLLILTLYSYVGLSYVVIRLLMMVEATDMGGIYMGILYFIGTAIALIFFLINTNKKLKQHGSI